MDIATVAEWLGVGERHVRRLISERRIPFVKWGHFVRFDRAQVDEWLRMNQVAPMRGMGPECVNGRLPGRQFDSARTLPVDMHDDQHEEFRHSGEYLKSLRERAGMTLEEVAERAGIEPAWLDNVERNGTHDLLYSEICNLVRATQPPRPDWWDEGYEHDLNLGPNAVVGPLTPSQQEYWARIEAVRAEIRRHYERGRRASSV
jgi:excisionase family DNA binding protein